MPLPQILAAFIALLWASLTSGAFFPLPLAVFLALSLVAGATAAADGADQLAAFDQRKAAGARDQGWVERGDVTVAGFENIIEQTRFTPEARRRTGLVDGNGNGCDLRALPQPVSPSPGWDAGDAVFLV